MGDNMDSDISENIFLEGDFSLHYKSKPIYHFTVSASRITYVPKIINRQVSESSLSSWTKLRRTGSIVERRSSVRSTSVVENALEDGSGGGAISFRDIIGCDCQKVGLL